MNKIKFRAWSFRESGMITEENSGLSSPEIYSQYGVIMQYAGFRDKKKNEIYDGDILRVQLPMGGLWGNVQREKVGKVEFKKNHCGFIVKWKQYSMGQNYVKLDCDIALEAELLGNIFENPELLETNHQTV